MLHSKIDLIQRAYLMIKKYQWEKIYEKINGGQKQGYICPYKGTGDVYLACALLSSKIILDERHTQTLVVIGNSSRKIVQLFGYKNIVVLSQEEMDLLMEYVSFMGASNLNLMILHPDPPNAKYGICDRLRNYNGLNFKDMFAAGIFGDIKIICEVPSFDNCIEEVKEYYSKNNLKPGRTIIISPYVNTLGQLPMWFWIELVAALTNLGFSVCTNCSGKEATIYGTVRLDIPYCKMKTYCEYAGYFIGSRSGLCEVISSFSMHKIIIYQPNLYWGCGGNIDYFSLNQMGLCNDAFEIEYEGIEFIDLMNDICELINNCTRSSYSEQDKKG